MQKTFSKIINEKEDKNNEMIEERRNYINYIDKYKKIIKDKLSIVSIDNAIEMTELILKFNSYKIYLEQEEKQKEKEEEKLKEIEKLNEEASAAKLQLANFTFEKQEEIMKLNRKKK